MTIPDYQACMLPLLNLTADGREHTTREAVEALASYFNLEENERKDMLPSGVQPTFDNRVGWASTYLRKALLLESLGRGKFKITQRGLEVLGKRPAKIDKSFLKQFTEFQKFDFRGPALEVTEKVLVEESTIIIEQDVPINPEEALDDNYQLIRNELARELLDIARKSSPRFFEKLVVDLLVAMGYGGSHKEAGKRIGRSGDDGIDGIIKEDKLGLDIIYIQAKRYQEGNVVGRPAVQAFTGSLEGHRARKGVFITTSRFTRDAIDYVERIEKKVILIDGEQLAQLMVDYDIGVGETRRYIIKKIDYDYFDAE